MTVKVHSGVCMKYSRWDIWIINFCLLHCVHGMSLMALSVAVAGGQPLFIMQ